MSIDPMTLAAILDMAAVSYLCRVSGIFLAGRLGTGARMRAALDAIPPAVLTAVIAPTALGTSPADTAATLVTAAAAWVLPLLPTIGIGVAAAALARGLFGG
jgi:uncharacterized membrane protein